MLSATRDSLRKAKLPLPVIDVLLKQQEAVAKRNMWDPEALELLQNLSLQAGERAVTCRLWTGDRHVFKLRARDIGNLKDEAKERFKIQEDEAYSLYNVGSCQKIEHDDHLDGFFRHAGPPTVFVWKRGDPDMSPASIPSEVELSALNVEDSELSSLLSPTRGYPQELFRDAVRARDKNVCVVTGMEVRPKTHNVQAAHIIGVEQGLAKARAEANILNPYNECNGMLLETSLHTAFNSYEWCMDEFLNIYVSPVGKLTNLSLEKKLKDKKINLQVGQPNYPTAEILRVRYALFKEKIKYQEEALIPRKRRKRDGRAVTL